MMLGVAHAESCKTGSSAVTLPDGVSPTMNKSYEDTDPDTSGNWNVASDGKTLQELQSIMASINSSDPITGIYGYYGYASTNPITNYADFKDSIDFASSSIGSNTYRISVNKWAHTSGDPSDLFDVTTQSGQVYQIQQTPMSACPICVADSKNPTYAAEALRAVNTTTGAIIK